MNEIKVAEASDADALIRPRDDPQRGRSFDEWADDYDRFRPSYPPELFDLIAARLQLADSPVVADLGAGTGRASLAMAQRGWRVVSVEPGAPMREVLARSARRAGLSIDVRAGTAEETGLLDESFDLVTAAQAFHWFDPPRALAEIARIIRPGGGLALFWNVRDDDRSPFLAAYSELLARYLPGVEIGSKISADETRTRDEIIASGLFEPERERQELHHFMRVTPAEFIGMSFTSSYVRKLLDDEAQARFRSELEALIAQHHGDGPFDVPYQIDLWLARRR